ncbi:PhoH family protein [Crocinitomix algicola]|uniref:PhoH family protein n=1 Tax=Crocinitomix algicola TaxID=1740263 RepID=UPI000871F35D|nr:PhoH family protein [Crocinitomix algicola]
MAKKNLKKIFVLDTSVLLFDHASIKNFKNNDVAIPITVLEELDNFKVGNDTKNFQAREVIRSLDKLTEKGLNDWVSLGRGKGKLKVVMANLTNGRDAEAIYGPGKNDHKIINAAITLADANKERAVVLVTKDINLRLKAKAIGLLSEDYETGKVKDVAKFSEGFPIIENIDSKQISELYKKGSIEAEEILGPHQTANGYYILKNGSSESVLSRYNKKLNCIERVEKEYVYSVKPRNAEQAFAVNALLNPEIKLVCLQGVAGTGKTLLALASALEQRQLYNQIILARPIIPLSNRDIGFLPGSAEDKISPYMQPLWDNLKFIKAQFRPGEKKHKILEEMEQSGVLSITALAFIRGRSLSNAMFIIDEAQNLSPHEVKTIITRAGEGTKIVFTGDIKQIDTPYMDEESNGLTYLIDRLKGHDLFAHIKLEKGERSELANLANELL